MNFNNLQIGTRLWLAVGLLMAALVAVVGFTSLRAASSQARTEAATALIDTKLRIAIQWAALTENNRTRTHATLISTEAAIAAELKPAMSATSAKITTLQKELNALPLDDSEKNALERIATARQGMLDGRKKVQALKAANQAAATQPPAAAPVSAPVSAPLSAPVATGKGAAAAAAKAAQEAAAEAAAAAVAQAEAHRISEQRKMAEAALQSIEQHYEPAAAAYAQTQLDFIALQDAAKKELSLAVAAERKTATMLLLVLAGTIVLGAFFGAYGLIRSIRQSLAEAIEVAGRIAQGDLTTQMVVTRRDEFGTLMRSLKTMTESLAQMVTQVRSSTDNIGTASSQIASGTQDLSSRTEHQASNLQQTASSMEELSATVKNSADSARQANQLASSAAEVAARGGSVVSQVVATMDEITGSSKKIADIIGVIDGIAFQTNILALNAAVEAARAGEQGRGFAVVATEVRSLAQRSAEAAKEIKTLIGASVDRVEAGSRLVADAGRTMQEIVGSVQRVTDIIGEITAAATEQSDGIGQVNTAVVQLDQMTQQNAALVEESAAAAESLKDQAARLADVVRTFKLHGQGAAAAA